MFGNTLTLLCTVLSASVEICVHQEKSYSFPNTSSFPLLYIFIHELSHCFIYNLLPRLSSYSPRCSLVYLPFKFVIFLTFSLRGDTVISFLSPICQGHSHEPSLYSNVSCVYTLKLPNSTFSKNIHSAFRFQYY